MFTISRTWCAARVYAPRAGGTGRATDEDDPLLMNPIAARPQATSTTAGEAASLVSPLVRLVELCAFREVAALVPAHVEQAGVVRRVRALCGAGSRLLDLDAEDFDDVEFVPGALAARIQRCWVPQHAGARQRGALRDLTPAYALMLEVLEVRWSRGEMLHVSAVLHLMAEYLPALAWQQELGHAADPLRMAELAGPDSLWGRQAARCPQAPREKSAARRSLGAADLTPESWRRYLDREHSHVAAGLASCAGCRTACALTGGLEQAAADALRERVALAEAFKRSPVVLLRHAAPVGHGFGVPSAAEVSAAWESTWGSLTGGLPLPRDGYPLPGLPALVGRIADLVVEPATLVAEVASVVSSVLSASLCEVD